MYIYSKAKLYVVISCCDDKYTVFYDVVGQNHEYSLQRDSTLAVTSRFELEFVLWLVETGSTRSSE